MTRTLLASETTLIALLYCPIEEVSCFIPSSHTTDLTELFTVIQVKEKLLTIQPTACYEGYAGAKVMTPRTLSVLSKSASHGLEVPDQLAANTGCCI